MSDATGSMTITKISDKSPFGKDLLVRDDCFILDNGANGKIFVWKGESILNYILKYKINALNYKRIRVTLIPGVVRYAGKGANAEEKQVSLQMADNFIDQMKYLRMKTQASRGLGSCSITSGPLWFNKAIYSCGVWRIIARFLQRAVKVDVLLCCRWRFYPKERKQSSSSSSSRTGTKHCRHL